MPFLSHPLTFDRVVRSGIFLAIIVGLVMLVRYLSPILVPFILAWALAWVLVPVVNFYNYKCHIPSRSLSILCALLTVLLLIVGVVAAVAPIFVEGFVHFKEGLKAVIHGGAERFMPEWMHMYVEKYGRALHLREMFSQEAVMHTLRAAAPKMIDVFHSTMTLIAGLVSTFFALLYLVFILKDYEKFSSGWMSFIPKGHRAFVGRAANEFGQAMRSYLRGQSLVALSNMIMFSIGFWIIGLDMWLPMGIFVGLISFIPYVQVAGFVPAAVLAFLEMTQGGRPFWLVMFLVLVVYGVVQIIQDAVVTPRVMGKMMGLSPAIILLALMVWGYVGGVVGLIVGLPLTTILIAYYKEFVIGEPGEEKPQT